jgi:hypothetical protein
VIRLEKPLIVMLPFQPQGLRLSHRLLESLGGVSRFILKALGEGLTLDQVSSVTALSEATLQRQVDFLTQHGFLDAPSSSEAHPTPSARGLRMMEVERLLQHGGHPTVWLDAFTLIRSSAVMLIQPQASELLADPAAHDLIDPAEGHIALMPVRSRRNRWFDELGRIRQLLDAEGMNRLLTNLWPDSPDVAHEELDHWDVSLTSRAEDEATRYLPLVLPASETLLLPERSERSAWPAVAVPVLDVTTRFAADRSLPWRVVAPPEDRRTIELFGLSEVATSPGHRHPLEPSELPASMCLPSAAAHTPMPSPATSLPLGISATVGLRRSHLRYRLDAEAALALLASDREERIFIRDRPVAAEATA